jgi:hypothetical protein
MFVHDHVGQHIHLDTRKEKFSFRQTLCKHFDGDDLLVTFVKLFRVP